MLNQLLKRCLEQLAAARVQPMTERDERDRQRRHVDDFASSPCFMHELDPAGLGTLAEPHQVVQHWRKIARQRLITKRLKLTADERRQAAVRIARFLDAAIGDPSGLIISGYWPFRAEPDLRTWFALVQANGGRCALPVVKAKGAPLSFRLWCPGLRMKRGTLGIPIPVDTEEVQPDIVIAPVVGFDDEGYRLGYGGGFFDMTLARMEGGRQAIGVGYSTAWLPTIYPQPHDVAMGLIVTEIEARRSRQ